MSRIVIIFIAVSFINTVNSFAQTSKASDAAAKKKNQTTGFYGKRFTLQLGASVNHNTILKLGSSKERELKNKGYYSNYRNQINKDQFNYSFYGSLGLVLKERTALSLDVNYYFGDIFIQGANPKGLYDEFGYYYGTVGGYDARVKYNTIRIMPRIEIGSRGSNMPTGLVNVLGLGVELSKLKSGNYKAITSYETYNYYYSTDSVSISDQNLKFQDEFAINLTVMYGLEYRLPLSKNIAWNFGGYAHINLPVQVLLSDFLGTVNYDGSSYDEQHKLQLSRYRFQNLFSLRTGLVIML